MSDFAKVNATYINYFHSNPPSRATVETDLPSPFQVSFECFGFLENFGTTGKYSVVKQVLHVQSISEWAPACIGPYSQATTILDVVNMAGQIALVPETMQMISDNLEEQTYLVLKHIDQVAQAMSSNVGQMIHCDVFLTKIDENIIKTVEKLIHQVAPQTLLRCFGVWGLPRNSAVEIRPTVIIPFSKNISDVGLQDKFGKLGRTQIYHAPYLSVWEIGIGEEKDLEELIQYLSKMKGEDSVFRCFLNVTNPNSMIWREKIDSCVQVSWICVHYISNANNLLLEHIQYT